MNPTRPGVFIQEFEPAAPIQGVGTSVPAFLGPAPQGPPGEVVKITAWDVFTQVYGKDPAATGYLGGAGLPIMLS